MEGGGGTEGEKERERKGSREGMTEEGRKSRKAGRREGSKAVTSFHVTCYYSLRNGKLTK